MAETNWILALVDRITAPMRNITRGTRGATLAAQEHAKAVAQAETSHKDLTTLIKKEEKTLSSLRQSLMDLPEEQAVKVRLEMDESQQRLRRYREQLQEVEVEMEQLNRPSFGQRMGKSWETAATGANQAAELFEKVASNLEFTQEIGNLQRNLQLMTGMTGTELESLTGKIHHVGAQFGAEDEEIARAANVMAKQMGLSYTDALDLISQGFDKGGNLSGDMLEQIKEYAPQMREAGVSAQQMMGIIAQSGKDGVFSDKSLDAIKEANLSLKEMGQAQVSALKGVGILPKDLKGKTSMEAVEIISEAMNKSTVTAQQKQAVIADIFKGAGEDAGMAFINGLGTANADITQMPAVEQSGAAFKGWLADVQTWASQTFGNLGTYVNGFVEVAGGIQTVVGLFGMLKNVTILQTAKQWLLNIAMNANPIGIIIGLVAALTGAIAYAWTHFEGFRKVVYGVWEATKAVFGGMGDFVGEVLDGIWGLIKGVFNPANWFDDDYHFADQLAKISGAAEKYGAAIKAGFDKGKAEGAASWQESQKDKPKPQVSQGTSADKVMPAPVPGKIGGYTPTGKDGKSGDGLSISGAGGTKAITMNLTVNNHFSPADGRYDIKQIAQEVTGMINDRIRDSLISN